ncbi:MAG: carbamoyl-phosphate synthase (glutamine-hydrolyzing) large subunit [Tuberibacillus sp.]
MPLRNDIKKVLVIGSGPIVIGQAAEFDYAGTQACLALKEDGIEVVLVNNNPATIMTDEQIADKIYMEPLTVQSVKNIIEKERPDGIIGTLGGQTGLNLAVELYEKGILDAYKVKLLGTSVESIKKGEDRELFRKLMLELGEPITQSKIVHSFEEGLEFAKEIGFPVIIRPAYTLGGYGGGFAENEEELEKVLYRGLGASPIHQVLIEKSIKGWKEIEYEVMRDDNDTCIIVCNMENIDPVGVHTGDSMVVAPSQTLTDVQYQMLRSASLRVIRALEIVGGCNIQFALDPLSNDYVIIEVNPRVSRSSALASKATGYPIARIAAKCALGYHLDEIINPITGTTFASFEPAIDYVVVKLPRFPFDKFPEADRRLGTQMKATGEVMAIDRTFEGALNKGIRSLELGLYSLDYPGFYQLSKDKLIAYLKEAADVRLFVLAEWFRRGFSVDEAYALTAITPWFLEKIKGMVDIEKELQAFSWDTIPIEKLKRAKQLNMSDKRLSEIYEIEQKEVREKRLACNIRPGYKLVDTCAAEFQAETPYYYSTWCGSDEAEVSGKPKILVVGSGPIRIGQGIEFDYCSVQAALAVKKKGYETIVMNNNPETVSTDYSVADKLYFEPLALEDILNVIDKEKVAGVLLQFGGQTAINLAKDLEDAGVMILGTGTDAIDQTEDRKRFYDLLEELEIPHIQGTTVNSFKELQEAAKKLGFPILVRPSYVIGGQSMFILHDTPELERYMANKTRTEDSTWPLLVDRYIQGVECEVDVISDGKSVFIPGIFEHIERAGVHSGDSIAIFPSPSISEKVKAVIYDYSKRLSQSLQVKGLMNIQFVLSDGVVHVLEVNPRSSRTVPIVSKITGIPMVEIAVNVQLGESLTQQNIPEGYLESIDYFAVKAPVFSTIKLKGVDPALGPEMKSTGERLGIGYSVKEALEKAMYDTNLLSHEVAKKTPIIICSFADREKQYGKAMVQNLQQRGFTIIATPGTASFLNENGLSVSEIKPEEKDIKELLMSGKVAAVINIPTEGRHTETFGFQLRQLATHYQTPLFTCLDTAQAILRLSRSVNKHRHLAFALNEYRAKTYQQA